MGGKEGIVIGYSEPKGRYYVQLNGSGDEELELALRPENLTQLVSGVEVVNLESMPSLNGALGEIIGCKLLDASTGQGEGLRYVVRLMSRNQVVQLAPHNVLLPNGTWGVRLHGLSKAELNDQ